MALSLLLSPFFFYDLRRPQRTGPRKNPATLTQVDLARDRSDEADNDQDSSWRILHHSKRQCTAAVITTLPASRQSEASKMQRVLETTDAQPGF